MLKMTAYSRRLRRAANPAARDTWQPDRLAVKAAGWFARLPPPPPPLQHLLPTHKHALIPPTFAFDVTGDDRPRVFILVSVLRQEKLRPPEPGKKDAGRHIWSGHLLAHVQPSAAPDGDESPSALTPPH